MMVKPVHEVQNPPPLSGGLVKPGKQRPREGQVNSLSAKRAY